MGCFSNSKIEETSLKTSTYTVNSKKLIHIVYLKTISSLPNKELQKVKQQLLSLKNVEGVKNLKVGLKADTSDRRHFENYNLVLQMEFDSIEALEKYSVDEFHLKVREKLKAYLATSPVVFDYWID